MAGSACPQRCQKHAVCRRRLRDFGGRDAHLVLPADVPDCETNVLVLHCLDVEACGVKLRCAVQS